MGYLLGGTEDDNLLKDPTMFKRLQDIANLPQEDKTGVLYAIDNLLRAAKLKTI
ncbi:MAG: hypothetical protein ACXITV_01075 [Luteibaculaceae bacterium]